MLRSICYIHSLYSACKDSKLITHKQVQDNTFNLLGRLFTLLPLFTVLMLFAELRLFTLLTLLYSTYTILQNLHLIAKVPTS